MINLASSAESFIGDQMSYLQENGDYEVHLICSPGDHLQQFCEEQRIKYKAIPLNRQLTPLQDIKAFFCICDYIRKNKIDIIFCHQAKARTIAIPASFIMRVKHRIIFAHGVLHETMHGLKRLLVLNNDRLLGRLATKVICVSHYVANYRLKDKIDKEEKQVIIGHGSCSGIDVDYQFNPSLLDGKTVSELKQKYGLQSDDFVIGFCGRLVKDKGVDELSEAIKILCRRNSNKAIKLLIIGSPEKRDAVAPYVLDALYDNPHVVFTGRVPSANMAYYYSLMDVFVLPSHRDGLGLVSLEAQAMEVPSIVSSVTGCRETIIENVTGKYCELNGDSIASAIEFFFDKEKAKSMGKEGRLFVERCFNHNQFKQDILKFVNTL